MSKMDLKHWAKVLGNFNILLELFAIGVTDHYKIENNIYFDSKPSLIKEEKRPNKSIRILNQTQNWK